MRIVYCEQGKRAVVKVVRKDTKNLKSLLGSCEPFDAYHPFARRELCLVMSELGEYDSELFTYEIVSGLESSDYLAFPEDRLYEGMETAHGFEEDAALAGGGDIG